MLKFNIFILLIILFPLSGCESNSSDITTVKEAQRVVDEKFEINDINTVGESGNYLITWTNNSDYYLNNISLDIVEGNNTNYLAFPMYVAPHSTITSVIMNSKYYFHDSARLVMHDQITDDKISGMFSKKIQKGIIYNTDISIQIEQLVNQNVVTVTVVNNTENNYQLKDSEIGIYSLDNGNVGYYIEPKDIVQLGAKSNVNVTLDLSQDNLKMTKPPLIFFNGYKM